MCEKGGFFKKNVKKRLKALDSQYILWQYYKRPFFEKNTAIPPLNFFPELL